MKKLMFMVMAACAIGFTSCGNKAQQAPADGEELSDSIEAAAIDANAEAEATITALSEQIEAKDATKLQGVIETVKTKIAEILAQNPEAAKEYVAKVQDFLKTNAESITAVVGDNAAVKAAVSALTEAPAETVVSGLMGAVEGVKATGAEAVEGAQEAVDAAVDNAKQAAEDKANEVKDAAKQKANDAVDAAADKAKKALGI